MMQRAKEIGREKVFLFVYAMCLFTWYNIQTIDSHLHYTFSLCYFWFFESDSLECQNGNMTMAFGIGGSPTDVRIYIYIFILEYACYFMLHSFHFFRVIQTKELY